MSKFIGSSFAVLLFATLVVGCSDDGDGTSGNGASGDEGSFTALTYNVAGLPEALSGSEPEQNMPLIAPLLDGYDLVLVQESWKTPESHPFGDLRVYHEILEEGSDHEHRSESAPLPLGEDPDRMSALLADGLNRFSRFPFTPVVRESWTGCFGGADTSDGGAADCLATKGVSFARTEVADGVEIDVYNLHMEAGSTEADREESRGQVSQLADFIAEHSEGRPVIVGGDFNLHDLEDEWDGESFSMILELTGLTDVCTELDCDDPGRIDKFLYRSDGGVELTPTSWNFETDVFVRDDGEPLSDHEALAVTFDWSTQG